MDRKEAIRDRILSSALTEFAAQGYRTASTNVICARAGVSKGTIFNYFPTKADLYWAVFGEELQRMLQAFQQVDLVSEPDPMERIWKAILWKIEYAQAHPEATRVMADLLSDPPEGLASRLKAEIGILQQLSIERFFADLPMDRIRPEWTRDDVIRHLRIALAGLQAVYVTDHPGFAFSEKTRIECFEFMKCVYRGMEKQDEQRV
jgi:AcrR family transcriptional regulator